MTKVKICGLMQVKDAGIVSSLHADYAGLMFYEKSKRFVPLETAKEIRAHLSGDVKAVGVFVNTEIPVIKEIAEAVSLDLIQLHGQETEETILAVKEATGLPVIKAFTVASEEDVQLASASKADFILLDHGAGGTGEAFDWSLISDVRRDFFLAGGLNPENVAEAVNTIRPFAVDVSSGVETDGKKDAEKITQFVNAVRSSNHES